MNSDLKILHLAKWYPHDEDPQNGVFIQQQIKSCTKFAKHAVLYWGTADVHHWNSSNEDEVHVLRMYFPKRQRLQNANRKWSSIRKVITDAFEDQKPDIIHLHIADADQFLVLEYAVVRGIPVVLTEHWSGYLDGRFDDKNPIVRSLITKLIKNATRVTTVSGFLADAIISKTGRKDVDVIPNAVDTEGINSAANSSNGMHFGVLADLDDKIKNVSGVIRAFRSFQSDHKVARLTIIGGGKDKEELEELTRELGLSEAVSFAGRHAHAKSLELLNAVDTVIINSRRETFSIVCLESIALGKKLICTRCGGPETFLNDDIVLWSRVNDDIELLRIMENSVEHPYPTQTQIIQQLEPFLPEVVAGHWQSLYASMVK